MKIHNDQNIEIADQNKDEANSAKKNEERIQAGVYE
jgi:hypothetical protein